MRVVSSSCRDKLVVSDRLTLSIIESSSLAPSNHGRVSVYIAYTEQIFVEPWN